MGLAPGTRIGPYEVAGPLGAGVMGEVYRATDTKLKRQLAIKILPSSLAADVDRLARFQREAEVLASLNHPLIAATYGLEESAPSTSSGQAGSGQVGITALVMELVEGDDLSQRIARLRAPGASARQAGMPLDEVLPIAKQIAEALEAAHEQDHSSRLEARQHQSPRGRHGEVARLRPRQSARSRCRVEP